MRRSEYRQAIEDMLNEKLLAGATVKELAFGIEEVNRECKLLPPEIRTSFRCTNGEYKVAYVNRWEIEQENL
jgi:hypothetical protein